MADSRSASDADSVADDHNDDICDICEDGGLLIVCDRCPRAYHRECIGADDDENSDDDDDWDCTVRKTPVCLSHLHGLLGACQHILCLAHLCLLPLRTLSVRDEFGFSGCCLHSQRIDRTCTTRKRKRFKISEDDGLSSRSVRPMDTGDSKSAGSAARWHGHQSKRGGNKHYKGFIAEGETFTIGDFVRTRAPDGGDEWIAVLEDAWEDVYGIITCSPCFA